MTTQRFEFRNFRYNRDALKPGVVHLGFGNFARSFLADILDDVAERGCTELGLVAVAPSDRQALDFHILGEQNNIYHLLRQNGDEICQRIGVLKETIMGAQHGSRVIDVMSRDETRIVTMTVTPDGYFPARPKDQSISRKQDNDLEALSQHEWSRLQTPPGWIVGALYARYLRGVEPFVVMSCDNILFNGDKTRELIIKLATHTRDPLFLEYVKGDVLFPNTAVDRITPQQNYDAQSEHLRLKAGFKGAYIDAAGGPVLDRRPVVSEHYRELVVQDNGRFPHDLVTFLGSAKVEFVPDISPYQDRKLRILNGAHMLFGIGGKLLQVDTVRDAMADPDLRALCDNMLDQAADGLFETHPLMGDFHPYVKGVMKRFGNPHLTDKTERLVSATYSKITARFANAAAIVSGTVDTKASAFAVAMWVRYLQGRDESGNPYSLDPADTTAAQDLGLAIGSKEMGRNLCWFLAKTELKDASPAWKTYVAEIVEAADLIQEVGLRRAINSYYPSPPANVVTIPQRHLHI